MRWMGLIAVLLGCSGSSGGRPPATAEPGSPAAKTGGPTSETLWDRGTFVTIDKEILLPDAEENFEIYRGADGYRIVVTWKRPAPTGERADGEVTFFTDDHFAPLQGRDVMTIHYPDRDEISRSTLTREPDGTLVTEEIAASGAKQSARSKGRDEWYVGGQLTTFLIALCQADDSVTHPVVYPDRVTTLHPFKPLPIEGSDRKLVSRTLVYDQSGREVIAACEGGKLAGEVARGTTIVRKGDVALARVLERWFR